MREGIVANLVELAQERVRALRPVGLTSLGGEALAHMLETAYLQGLLDGSQVEKLRAGPARRPGPAPGRCNEPHPSHPERKCRLAPGHIAPLHAWWSKFEASKSWPKAT